MKKILSGLIVCALSWNVLWAGEPPASPGTDAPVWSRGEKPKPVEIKAEKPSSKRGFWRSRSKTKLWWGVALAVVGAGAASYGLSTHVTSHQEMRTVTLSNPSSVTLSDPAVDVLNPDAVTGPLFTSVSGTASNGG